MYRTLTGQLDAIVTRSASRDDSEEWEVEEGSYTDDSDVGGSKFKTPATTVVAQPRQQPLPVQYSNTPDEHSPNTSGPGSKAGSVLSTARTGSGHTPGHDDDDEDEYEYEDEDEYTEEL